MGFTVKKMKLKKQAYDVIDRYTVKLVRITKKKNCNGIFCKKWYLILFTSIYQRFIGV